MDDKDPFSLAIGVVYVMLTTSVGIFNFLQKFYPSLELLKQCNFEMNLYTSNPCACWRPIRPTYYTRRGYESIIYEPNRIQSLVPFLFVALSLVLAFMNKITELFEMLRVCNYVNFFLSYVAIMDMVYCPVEYKRVIIYNYYKNDATLNLGFIVFTVFVLKHFVPNLSSIENEKKRLAYRKKYLFRSPPISILWFIILCVSLWGMYTYDEDNDENFPYRCACILFYYLSIAQLRRSVFYVMYNNKESDYMVAIWNTSRVFNTLRNSTSQYYVCHSSECTASFCANIFAITFGPRYMVAIDDTGPIKAIYCIYWKNGTTMRANPFASYKDRVKVKTRILPISGQRAVEVELFDADPTKQTFYLPCRGIHDSHADGFHKAWIVKLASPDSTFKLLKLRKSERMQELNVDVFFCVDFMFDDNPNWKQVIQFNTL